ncbi:hypothetical protein E2C01_072315 [Portunus trituberculatus]|uniref:Uncharacterized protein n=1 Tax=Portunus trituberculatus TaxID=210409 RepID=A0A5B7I8L8_PORTR|nr:hypothetical protein [Portunus trituberculatus]
MLTASLQTPGRGGRDEEDAGVRAPASPSLTPAANPSLVHSHPYNSPHHDVPAHHCLLHILPQAPRGLDKNGFTVV